MLFWLLIKYNVVLESSKLQLENIADNTALSLYVQKSFEAVHTHLELQLNIMQISEMYKTV